MYAQTYMHVYARKRANKMQFSYNKPKILIYLSQNKFEPIRIKIIKYSIEAIFYTMFILSD